MRAVTFNIRHGVGAGGGPDLGRVAATLAALEPDIVGLQEVDRHWSPRSGFADQARDLARRLRMRLAYGATLDLDPPAPGRPRRRFGNALLARRPIAARSNRLLPTAPGIERRGLLSARIDLGGRSVTAHVTHLEPRDPVQRGLQAATVAVLVAAAGATGNLLLADLNAEPGFPELAPLAAVLLDAWTAGDGPGWTYPAAAPRRRLDAVLHSPDLLPLTAVVPWTDASDHRPVLAVFDTGEAERTVSPCRPRT